MKKKKTPKELWNGLNARQRAALLKLDANRDGKYCEGAGDLVYNEGLLELGADFNLSVRGRQVAEYGRGLS